MIGIYLSGTGNTKHCIEKLAYLMDSKSKTIPLEDDNVIEEIKKMIQSYWDIQFSILIHHLWLGIL